MSLRVPRYCPRCRSNVLWGRAEVYGRRVRACQRCGAPHNLDTSIPSEAWNVIVERNSPGEDKYGALCTLCIDELLTEKGTTAEAEFYYVGTSLVSRMYADAPSADQGLSKTKDSIPVPPDVLRQIREAMELFVSMEGRPGWIPELGKVHNFTMSEAKVGQIRAALSELRRLTPEGVK